MKKQLAFICSMVAALVWCFLGALSFLSGDYALALVAGVAIFACGARETRRSLTHDENH